MPSALANQWSEIFKQTQAAYTTDTDQTSFTVAFSFLVSPNGPAQHAALLDKLVQLEQFYASSIRTELDNVDKSVKELKRQQLDELIGLDDAQIKKQRGQLRVECENTKAVLLTSVNELALAQQQEYQAVVVHLFHLLQTTQTEKDDPETIQALLEAAVGRLLIPVSAVLKQYMAFDFTAPQNQLSRKSSTLSSSVEFELPVSSSSAAGVGLKLTGSSPGTHSIASKLKKSLSMLSLESSTDARPKALTDLRKGSISSLKEKTVLSKFGSLFTKIIDSDSKPAVESSGSPKKASLLEPIENVQPPIKSPSNEENLVPSPIYSSAHSATFSLYLGTQVRRLYNLQLAPCSVAQLVQFPRDYTQELAIRLATSRELYRPHALKALLVVVRKSELEGGAQCPYFLGKGSNKQLFKACQDSHELHFDSITEQLAGGLDALTGKERAKTAQEGDLLVTRHSSLPAVHLVMHLVVDDKELSSPLKSQSPLLLGLRNVIKLLDVCTVSHLTLPLNLLPDTIKSTLDAAEPPVFGQIENPLEYVAQRCQHVLKTLKAGFGESEGLAKHGTYFQNIALHGRWITALAEIPSWCVLSSPATMKQLSSAIPPSIESHGKYLKVKVNEFSTDEGLALCERVQEKITEIFRVQ